MVKYLEKTAAIYQKMTSKLRKNGIKRWALNIWPSLTNTSEADDYDSRMDCPVPYVSCVCRGLPLPISFEGEDSGVRMRCTNECCTLAPRLLHKKCFEHLETTLLKVLSNRGSARGWTDAQLRSNLWEKKGQNLIGKMIRCHCGLGQMNRDTDFYKKREIDEQQKVMENVIQQSKKRVKKKNRVLPTLNFNSSMPAPIELIQSGFGWDRSRKKTTTAAVTPTLAVAIATPPTTTIHPTTAISSATIHPPAVPTTIRIRKNPHPQPLKLEPQQQPPVQNLTPIRLELEENDETLRHDKEKVDRFYSLFDPSSRGFYLGEILMAEAHLPRLLPHSA